MEHLGVVLYSCVGFLTYAVKIEQLTKHRKYY